MTVEKQDMTEYDENTDPREIAQAISKTVPPITHPEGWLLQVSLKTPVGTLINIRGLNSFDVAVGLEAIRGMAQDILDAEQMFSPVPAAVQQLRPVQAPPQRQQQAPYGPPQQQAGGWGQQAPQPPQQAPQGPPGQQLLCNCGYPAKYVQGGISRKTGRAFRAFYACGNPVREAQCNFRADA